MADRSTPGRFTAHHATIINTGFEYTLLLVNSMLSALLLVAVLLLVGVAVRLSMRVFQRLYIPASVIAGVIGLIVIQSATSIGFPAASEWATTLRSWPGWLIAIVFAGMLLERKPSPVRESLSRVGRQGLMVWVIVLGQTAIGLLVTWLLIQRFFNVPNSFGMLIETGFAGGHGTAAAMGQVFAHPSIDLEGGLDLGILMATSGLLYGLLSGIFFVNVGVRAGWVQKQDGDNSTDRIPSGSTPVPIGYAKVGGETIDPLLLQLIWIAFAFGIGMGLHASVTQLVGLVEGWIGGTEIGSQAGDSLSSRLTLQGVFGSFPLFIYTLFGGLIVRRMLHAIGKDQLIDRETINRLTSTAMDILVVAAIATLNLSAVATLIVPFSILLFFGVIWSGICLLVISRWVLPKNHWFELGLINYGMSTGTTATGFVLLRLVDPELESGAAEDYALAAPLSSPFVGGGMLTVALPLLVLERANLGVIAIGLGLLVISMIMLGRRWNACAD